MVYVWQNSSITIPSSSANPYLFREMATSNKDTPRRKRDFSFPFYVRSPLTFASQVSLAERWNVCRRNAGFPISLTILVAYPSLSASPTEASLSASIVDLQDHFPLLCSRIGDSRTRVPVYEQLPKPWPASDILFQRRYEPVDGGLKEKHKLLSKEVKRSSTVDIDVSPLWQVSLYTAPTKTGPVYLTLSADHALTDGRGLLLLLEALLNPSSIASLPYESLIELPLHEDTMDMRPTWSQLLPPVLRRIILPHFPQFIQNFFAAKPYWPQGEIMRDPTTVPEASSLIELPGDVLARLKVAGKEHNVPTLNATVMTAYLVAMWSVHIRTSSKDQRLTAAWPADERIPSLGHPYCTGMYISSFNDNFPLSPPADFWTEAARTYAYTTSAAGRKQARGAIGILGYIPDRDPANLELKHSATEWEDLTLSSASGQSAVRYSLGFSNLGYVDLPAGANDVMWTQNCWPLGMALIANVIGHRNGLRVVSIWMEGAMVTEDQVKEVEETFVKILERLTDPRWNKTRWEELVS